MRGLLNLGNTCYFNTAVQCLAHAPPLSRFLIEAEPYTGPCDVTREYQKVVRQLFLKDVTDPVDPSALLGAFRTRFPSFANPNEQHDAQEVILVLIDLFEKSFSEKFIRSIFNGQECQETVYPKGVSKKESEFVTCILFPTSETSLEDLIKRREKHVGIEGYVDDDGTRYNIAAVRQVVTRWPRILGFTFSMYENKFPIKIPLEFGDHKLFALVIHQGIQWGGHYALIVRRHDKWFIKDDDTVREIPEVPLQGPFYMAWYRS